MVRFSILGGLLAVATVLTSGSLAKGLGGGTQTGIHASIDLRTLSQAKDTIFDQIISFIDDVKIPDVQLKGNKGYLIENSVIVTLTNIILQGFEIQVPNTMLGGLFKLSQLHLEYFDGYIYAGVTPVYIPPAAVPLHTVHDHPSAPKIHDHPLPMNDMVNYNGHNFRFIQD